MADDVERLRRDVPISEIAGRFGIALKRDGAEWVACCPIHAEDTPSFTVFNGRDGVQRFHCFGCGAHGDVLDLVMGIQGVKLPEAIRILDGGEVRRNVKRVEVEVRDPYAGIAILPLPEKAIEPGKRITLYNPKRAGTEWETGSFTPALVHTYPSVGYVLRRNLPDGHKETPMVAWVRLPSGKEVWSRFPFPKPRPLYGLDTLGDAKQVFVVEGEKCRDAFERITYRKAVSWAGGTEGVKHTDWTPLRGRNVVIWPDADAPGLSTANAIAAVLFKLDCTVRLVVVPAGEGNHAYPPGSDELPPDGWDVADAERDGWVKADIDAYLRSNLRAYEPPPVEIVVRNDVPERPAKVDASVVEARTVEQAKPEHSATVTDIRTLREYEAGDAWQMELERNDKNATKPNVAHNWAVFLKHHEKLRGIYAYDEFKSKVMLLRRPPWEDGSGQWKPRAMIETDTINTAMALERFHLTPKATTVYPVIGSVAVTRKFDALKDYLNGLKWDGKKRVETFLTYYFGVDDGDYARTVSRCWIVSSAARGLKPGCKVDTMPILEGRQGLKKSSAVQTLYSPEWTTTISADVGSKDSKQGLNGMWGVEVAEMHKMTQADARAVKDFLSTAVDKFRPPFAREQSEFPRRAVMVGTINPEGNPYLTDPTGARRFWPVECKGIDLDGIKADRDQIWAEAVALFQQGVPWWVQEDEQNAVMAEQAIRSDVDPWAEVIAPAIRDKRRITEGEIMEALGIPKRERDKRQGNRIGVVMKRLGWRRGRSTVDGEDVTVYSLNDLVENF